MKIYDDMDYLLSLSRPTELPVKTEFTDKVMLIIEQREIFSRVVRITDVTRQKETWFMKFKKLPITAIIAIGLFAAVSVGGVAYAVIELWPKPNTSTREAENTHSGRNQLISDLENCSGDSKTSTKRYELKENATITKEEVPAIVQAQCELNAIQAWAEESAPEKFKDDHATNMVNTSTASRIKSIKNDTVTIRGDDGELEFTTSQDTIFIADGTAVNSKSLKVGDPVVVVSYDQYDSSGSGFPKHRTLHAIIKLDLPYESYDQQAFQSLTEIVPCIGNSADDCKTGYSGSIDVYYRDDPSTEGEIRQINGQLTQISANGFSIKSTSGTIFKFNTSTNLINEFNVHKSGNYGGNTIVIGDSLTVFYRASDELNATYNFGSDDLDQVSLDLEIIDKNSSINKY